MPYTVPKGATTHASIPKCRAPKTGQGRCTTYTEAQDSPRACVPRAHSAHMQSIQDRPRTMHTSQRPKTVQGHAKPLRTPRTLQCALLLLQTRGLLPGSCIPSGKAKSKQQNTRYSGVALQGLCLAFGKAMWPTLLCQPSDHNKHEAAIFFPMIRCTQAWTGHRQHQPMTSQATAPWPWAPGTWA